MRRSATYLLLDERLKKRGGLPKCVAALRSLGYSWRDVSDLLERETGHRVTHETLRTWFPEDDANGGEGEAA
jgi:hypothetical protein